MTKIRLLFLTALCVVLLAACGCEHVWGDATCTEGPTCTECGKAQKDGKALGHKWQAATCTTLKTCKTCGATEGELNEHSWRFATCTEPKTCKTCGLIEGEPLSHQWKDATCTKPKTCDRCKATDGAALGHSIANATCTEKGVCTVCGVRSGSALGHDYVKNVCTRCGDKEIETLSELVRYLNKTYPKLQTAVGLVESITYEYEDHSDDLFAECDFELQIMSTLYSKERKYSISYLIKYGNMLPYEDRIQAAVDVLDFEMELAQLLEDVFPGKKYAIYFYDWGSEYPSIKVGFNSTKYLPVLNYKKNNSGVQGYGSTDRCSVYMDERKLFADGWLHEGWFSEDADKIYDDIIAACDYELYFSYHSKLYK